MVNNKGHVLSFSDNPIGENSPIESVKYNKIISSLKTSVIRCINRTRELTTNVSRLNAALSAENMYLTANYNSNNYINNNGLSSNNTALITGYDQLFSSSNIIQDSLTGKITLKYNNSFSKIPKYIDSNGNTKAVKDVYISFGETGNLEQQPLGSSIYDMVDGNNNTFWLYDSAVEGQEYNLQIQFPVSLKPSVNYLKLLPFPAFGFDLTSVSIKLSNGSMVDITDSIDKEQGIINTYFKTLSWGGILDIKFKARGSVLGITELDIGYSDFSDNVGEFVVSIPSFTNKSFTAISNLNLFDFGLNNLNSDFDISFIKADNITATLYQGNSWETATDEQVIYKDTINGINSTPYNKTLDLNLYVKFNFKKYINQTPIFRGVSITYED